MPQTDLVLHGYFRSSAAYRVRIALELKGLGYAQVPVHLLRNGGEQWAEPYLQLNPQGLVPTLRHGDVSLTQSLAIIEYLEECHPEVPLLPEEPLLRARARQFAAIVACDIHPLNNLRVLKYLSARLGIDDKAKQDWIRHWIDSGFAALESELQSGLQTDSGRYCIGDSPTLADCCLIPQVFNAVRFGVDVARYPRIASIAAACEALPAFQRAHPSQQPDAE